MLACFAIAVSMIASSYKEWQESPVSTTITTHPITELEFPTATVCPPRGSNTALNHLLEKVKDVNFTEKEKQKLLNISKEVFLEIPNKKHAKDISALLSSDNMRSIMNGQTSLPNIDDDQNTITLQSSEPEGTFQTPGYNDSEFDNEGCEMEFFNKHHSFHFMLDFPDNIEEMVGMGSIFVSLQTKGRGSVRFQGNRLELYNLTLENMRDAEDFCVSRGGHLASVGSQEDQDEIAQVAEGEPVWLGGMRIDDEWQWLDGTPWSFENWDASWNDPSSNPEYNCLFADPSSGNTWWNNRCTGEEGLKVICLERVNAATMESKDESLALNKSPLWLHPFHVWWTHSYGESVQSEKPGIKLSWKIVNGSLPDVKESVHSALSGSVSTPELGSIALPDYYNERHEYTAVIELPYNISDVMGDGALIIDVEVVLDNLLDSQVQFLSFDVWPLSGVLV